MKKKLFEEAFKKAENQCGNNTKHGLSSYLERVFVDDLKFQISKITFVRYYEKYIEEVSTVKNNPGSDLLNKIAEYVECESYEDFVSKNNSQTKRESTEDIIVKVSNGVEELKNTNTLKVFFKESRISVFVFGLLLIGLVIFYSFNKQHWMIWEGDHYVKVKFNEEKYSLGELKLYDKNRVKLLKIQADCNTVFFDLQGNAKVWYGKNNKKELEFFTALALHPETGKTLDPITKYMIRKYICEDY